MATVLGVGVRGRGAKSNASGRYEALRLEAFDDGWTLDDPAPVQRATTLTAETARVILSRNDSPDISFDRSINPYRGCEHGCIYCYARPAHAYMGLSPGVDFETKLFFKPEAARLLEGELSRRSYECRPVHIGGNTDPYQPAEKGLRITRGVLEVLERFNHPLSIITKSALIVRDADILARMGAQGLARAFVSITTLDRKLARAMEPRAATPERRLDAVRALADAGVIVGVLFAPVIPGLNDHELEAVLARAAEAGASSASYVVLRLPLEIKELFREWLETERPERARRVMSLVRQMRGGKDYDADWSQRMKGRGPVAELIRQRYGRACAQHGFPLDRVPLRTDLFRPPPRAGDQMELFGGVGAKKGGASVDLAAEGASGIGSHSGP
jgi:DNA repair photolyase